MIQSVFDAKCVLEMPLFLLSVPEYLKRIIAYATTIANIVRGRTRTNRAVRTESGIVAIVLSACTAVTVARSIVRLATIQDGCARIIRSKKSGICKLNAYL